MRPLLNSANPPPPPLPPYQRTPVVKPTLCATMKGMLPYKPKGELSRYSNTSRLYSRYGSDSTPPVRRGEGGGQGQGKRGGERERS